MAIINKPLTEPGAIETVLGISNVTDPTRLMRPDLYGYGDIINKWSKTKPLDRPTTGTLSDDNRKAYKASQGIYWGLQAGTATGDWANIHKATWAYVDRPTGGIASSPYRLDDFLGYDSNATATLSGYSGEADSGKINYGSGTPFGLELTWNRSGNSTGVDVFACTNLNNVNLQNYYLFILIDTWCTAMINNDAGNTVNPILYNNTECRRFSCPSLPSNLKTNATRTVSFFLSDINDVNSNIKNSWINTNNLHMGVQAISIPGAVAKTVKFETVSTEKYGVWTNGTITKRGANISVSWTLSTVPTQTTNYEVRLEVNNQLSTVKRTFTIDPSLPLTPVLSWGTMDLSLVPFQGQTLTCEAILYAIDGSQTIRLATASGTITW